MLATERRVFALLAAVGCLKASFSLEEVQLLGDSGNPGTLFLGMYLKLWKEAPSPLPFP